MCAIFGLIDYNHTLNAKQREKVLRVLSQECEERGTDATGFAYNSRGKLTIFKRPFAAHNVHLKLRDDATVIMGHTRMATQGNKLDNRNNHPFPGVVNGMHFALAHNGVLHNDLTLRAQMKLLLCYGYFVEEIEEMLYHPGEFEQALAEILDECAYDYCGEW